MRQPSGRCLRITVNRPCGWSFARFSFHRPDATAESDDNSVISRSENVSVPIFRATGIFFPVTIAHGLPAASERVFRNKDSRCRAVVPVHKSINIAPVPSNLLCLKNRSNLRKCICGFFGRGGDGRCDHDATDDRDRVRETRDSGERRPPACRSRQLAEKGNSRHS
jgi:hypothetical protein